MLQVAPSFFDAPGAQGSSGSALPSAIPGTPTPSPAPAPQLFDDQLPDITFAFASEVGYKVSHIVGHAACCSFRASYRH